jgi:hypothetical protein
MPQPYKKLLFDRRALRALGAMAPEVQDCLKQAFKELKVRTLEVQQQTPWRASRAPGYVRVCQHTLYVSENTDKNVLVVLYMLADTGSDDGDLY